jgi:hypothetical protein
MKTRRSNHWIGKRASIQVTEEAPTSPRLENRSSENPPRRPGVAGFQDWAAVDAGTATPLGKPKQPGMSNVPPAVEKLNISVCDRNLMPLNQFPKGT